MVVDVGRRSTCCHGSKWFITNTLTCKRTAQQRKLLFLNLFIFISGNLYFLLRAMGSSKIWRCRVSDVCTYPRLRHVIGVNAMDSRICCLLPLYPTRQPQRRKYEESFTLIWKLEIITSCNNVQNYRLYFYVFFSSESLKESHQT